MKVRKFYEPIFDATVHVYYDCSGKEAETYFAKHFGGVRVSFDDCLGQVGTIFHHNKNRKLDKTIFYMYLEKGENTLSTLVHEITHLSTSILKNRRVGIGNGELMAYYNEYWFKQLRSVAITKNKKKKQ